ncbi:hypothetical protein YPPY36_0563 [Yersinia pestis PY-36]|nr:hypothetical protein YPPY36_0563 [Yersinia pestis PY-36]
MATLLVPTAVVNVPVQGVAIKLGFPAIPPFPPTNSCPPLVLILFKDNV